MTSDKREKAIKYLTEEIRSLRMAPQINGCGPENWEEQLEIMETCLEAVRGHGNQPLTLEQLRKMDGNPVRVEFEDGSGGLWGVVHISVFEQIIFPNGLHCTIGHPYYGKIYKAYAYHPANIDREVWTAEWIYPESKWSLPRCSKCECNSKDAQYGHKDNFCPKCGRAMTPEAWAELEKRLRGNYNGLTQTPIETRAHGDLQQNRRVLCVLWM